MNDQLKRLNRMLTRDDRVRFAWLVVAFVVMSLFETVGVASIAPFMQLVARPEVISEERWLSALYDWFGFGSQTSFLFAAGIAVLVLLGTANAVSFLVTWFQYRVVYGSMNSFRTRLFSTYLSQPYEFFLTRNSSELSNHVLSEVTLLASRVMIPIVKMIGRVFVVIAMVALLVMADPVLALTVTVVLGGCYGAIYFFVRPIIVRLGDRRYHSNKRLFRAGMEAFGSIKALKASGTERFFLRRFSRASTALESVQPKFGALHTAPMYLMQTVAFGGIILIVLFLLASASDVDKILPILSLYALAGYKLMPSLQTIFQSFSDIKFNGEVIDSLYADMMIPAIARIDEEPDEPMAFRERLQVRDLTMVYAGAEDPAVRGVSLDIEKGSRIAFVGPTGSGKTTLADVVTGLLPPSSGEVLIDGVPLTPHNVGSWRRVIGYVPQEAMLYDDTIMRNIGFGMDDAQIDEELVRWAAKAACIDEFITESLPEEYETLVGERGVRLSGGQRQRIALARALYRRPQLLVLDEATSALDGITELSVMKSMVEMDANVTVIMIAHRLSTVAACDVIYILEDGVIVEAGTYDELLDRSEIFRGMAKAVEV